MATEQKIIPISIWRWGSRTAQVLASIVIIGLDIFVIDEWNQNKFSFNSAAGNAPGSNIKTWVGGTPFTGIVMFTAVLTLFANFYDLAAPSNATPFYHIYGEIVLELFLIAFWMVSFAGMASYVQEISMIDSMVVNYETPTGLPTYGDSPDQSGADLASNTRTSENCCRAIAVLGALIFALALANFLALIAFVVKKANSQQSSNDPGIPFVSHSTRDPEQGVMPQTIPRSFGDIQEKTAM